MARHYNPRLSTDAETAPHSSPARGVAWPSAVRGVRLQPDLGRATGPSTAAIRRDEVLAARRRQRVNVAALASRGNGTGEKALEDFGTRPGNFQDTPLMIDNVLYLSTPYNRVVALNRGDRRAAVGVRSESLRRRTAAQRHRLRASRRRRVARQRER
jgi:hypothetical protein